MRIVLIIFLSAFCSTGFAQNDSLIRKLDSLERKADTVGVDPRPTGDHVYTKETRINADSYFKLLFSNFEQQVTAPFHASKKDWLNVGKFALVTGAIALTDVPVQKAAVRFRENNPSWHGLSKFITDFGGPYEFYTLAALGTYGFLFKKEKTKTTVLLATQSYITAGVIVTALKYLTGRQRPNYYGIDSIAPRATFHGPFSENGRAFEGSRRSPAFPSGHAAVAFAAATVFALQYKDKPLIPIVAYSAASLIGVSRITENKHWATDVLVGAVIGYLSGRQVVNNFHRYSKLKRTPKSTVSLSMGLMNGRPLPTLVYRF